MDLIPATAVVRGNRIARVKFVALPMEREPGNTLREASFPGRVRHFLFRVIGRLVAARP